MLSFLHDLALHSIKVLSHFFKSHLNPRTRFAFRLPWQKDFILPKVRFVAFSKNGNALCRKSLIEIPWLARKYSGEDEEEWKKTCSFSDVPFSFVFTWSDSGVFANGFVPSFF